MFISNIEYRKATICRCTNPKIKKIDKENWATANTLLPIARMDCAVCCEPFNNSTRKLVDCRSCSYKACTSCVETYILGSLLNAHCMSCKIGITRETLCDKFTSKFVNQTYKKHREVVLLEREKSLMPATQPYVEMLIKVNGLLKERHILDAVVKKLTIKRDDEMVTLKSAMNSGHPVEDIMAIKESIKGINIDISTNTWEIDTIQFHINILMNKKGKDTGERREFIRPCPATDCRGFLSTQWKCGICSVNVCKDCHEIKTGDEHTCKPENLETAKMIMKECKACPKCGVSIFKIEGCDQMWCTQCRVTFSWRTGRLEEGRTHNPHYYQWLREQGGNVPREIGDVPCGGIPNWTRYRAKFQTFMLTDANRNDRLRYRFFNDNEKNTVTLIMGKTDPDAYELEKVLGVIHRFHGHVMAVELPRYRNHENIEELNRDLRAKYMMNEIDEESFKVELQRREKSFEKRQDIFMVMQTFVAVCTDMLQRLYAASKQDEVNAIFNEFKQIRMYTNTSMLPISKRYHCVVPIINITWEFENGATYARSGYPPTVLV